MFITCRIEVSRKAKLYFTHFSRIPRSNVGHKPSLWRLFASILCPENGSSRNQLQVFTLFQFYSFHPHLVLPKILNTQVLLLKICSHFSYFLRMLFDHKVMSFMPYKTFVKVQIIMWAEERSRYSSWLWAGRTGDRIPVGARFSAPVQTGPGAHPASCKMGTGSFPRVKNVWDMTLIPHPLLVPWSRKGRAIPLPPLWAVRPVQSLSACTRVHFTLPLPYKWLCSLVFLIFSTFCYVH
jgi:hypothetical protein